MCAHVPKAQFVYVTEAQHTGEPQVEAALPGVSTAKTAHSLLTDKLG